MNSIDNNSCEDYETIKVPNSQRKLIKYLSIDEITKIIHKSMESEVVKIMIFIKGLYESKTIKESADIVGYGYESGLRWLDKWNEKGLEGIKYKWGDGRPSKLTENQKKELKEDMLNLDLKTTKQIKEHIKNKWGIDYAVSWLPHVLKSFGAKYGKPYPKYAKEPENADEILHEQVIEIKKELKDKNIEFNDIIFVFMDEGSFNNTDNSQRVWYFENNLIEKNSNKERANTIIYYSQNGESHIEFLEKSTKEHNT